MNLELFGCSGGMAEGFRRAGIRFDLVIDFDPDACDSYEANLGHRPVRMDVSDLLRMARIGWRPADRIDLIVADPPCTPWSRAGKGLGTDDKRDRLAETVDLIRLLLPSCWLIGNVPGLQDAPNWHIVQDLIGGLFNVGYCVKDYAQLNAADYGVPQHRIRPFWFGHLDGPCLRWPQQTHSAPAIARNCTLPGLEPLKPWVTCREALMHLPLSEIGKPIRVAPRMADGGYMVSEPDKPARVITTKSCSGGSLIMNPKHPISRPDEPSMTICCRDRGGAQGGNAVEWPWERPATAVCCDERLAYYGHHEGGSWLTPRRPEPWPWNRPSTVVQASIDKIAPANEKGGRFGPNAIRLTEKAAAILQGFPKGWVFVGRTKRSRWSQIGQAMPPPLAAAVATSLRQQIGAPR